MAMLVGFSTMKGNPAFFFQAEDGIRDVERSRGLGDVYKRQEPTIVVPENRKQKNRLSLSGVETHTGLWLLSFCSTAARKTCFSHI